MVLVGSEMSIPLVVNQMFHCQVKQRKNEAYDNGLYLGAKIVPQHLSVKGKFQFYLFIICMEYLFYASDSINFLLNLSNMMAHGHPKLNMSTLRFPYCTHPSNSFFSPHFNEENCQCYVKLNKNQGFMPDSSSLPSFISNHFYCPVNSYS